MRLSADILVLRNCADTAEPGRAARLLAICIAAGIAIAAYPGSASAGDWIRDAKTQCEVWNPKPQPANTSILWSGPCVDGRANGAGTLTWFENGKERASLTATFKGGRPNGHFKSTLPDGSSVEGEEYHDDFEGHIVWKYPDKTSVVGEWKKGVLQDGEVVSPEGKKRTIITGFGPAKLFMSEAEFADLDIAKKSRKKTGEKVGKAQLCDLSQSDGFACYFAKETIEGTPSLIEYFFYHHFLLTLRISAGHQINARSACLENMNQLAKELAGKYGQFDSAPKKYVREGDVEEYEARLSFPDRFLALRYWYFPSKTSLWWGTRCTSEVVYQLGAVQKGSGTQY